MPSGSTIASGDLTDFASGTTIRSGEVDDNFSIWRGNVFPVEPNTSAASDAAYDLGASDKRFKDGYFSGSLYEGGKTIPPTGSILPFAGDSAPSGWLKCDGSSLSRTTYATLFAIIGTAHGTATTTSFNIPDLRGRVLRGVDSGAGRDPDAATRTAAATGGNTGDTIGSVQLDAFQSHKHTSVKTLDGISLTATQTAYEIMTEQGLASDDVSTSSPVSDGSGTPQTSTETRSKNIYVNHIIRYL